MAEAVNQRHIVIFSRSCLYPDDETVEKELKCELKRLSKKRFVDLFYTSHTEPANTSSGILNNEVSITFVRRGGVLRTRIKECWDNGDVVVIVGAVDEDLHVAATTKCFLIGAKWVECGDKVIKYGVDAPTPKSMMVILQIIMNQSGWYYKCTFDDPVPTVIVSLCKANTYGAKVEQGEKELAEKFQAVLKDGNKNPVIRKAMMCHLMAAITHDKDFREVRDWAVAPSSSTEANPVLEELKEDVRFMMNGRKSQPIFKRHRSTSKSRWQPREERSQPSFCQRHFDTIVITEEYRKKLKGKVVCVMDDYLTYGNTFEALRNLLVACGVKKIFFIAIGKFMQQGEVRYDEKFFTIEGDVHSKYEATFEKSVQRAIEVHDDARRSLSNLNELAKILQKS